MLFATDETMPPLNERTCRSFVGWAVNVTLCNPGDRSTMVNNTSLIAGELELLEVGRMLLSSATVYVQLLVPRSTIPFPTGVFFNTNANS